MVGVKLGDTIIETAIGKVLKEEDRLEVLPLSYSFGYGSRESNLSCMSPSRLGWLSGFLRARNARELSVFRNFISFGCRATLLSLAPLSCVFCMCCTTPYK